MVNFGLNSASILGIFLAVAGAGLYFMRSFRPELARDQDIFFAAVGLLCGFILLFQGWRLDPILQFGQFLLTGTTVFFAYEAIRLRAITRKEVIDKTRIVDDERTPSRVYRYDQEAELYDQDQLEPEEEVYTNTNRRLRGTVDSRNNRTARYEGDARPSRSRGDSERERPGSGERSPKRRPRPTTNRSSERPVESWEADLDTGSSWEDKPTRNSRPRPTTRPDSSDVETEPKPRKRRPPQDRRSSPPSTNMETTSSDYVDYQPIDPSEEEKDNRPGRFDY